MATTDTIVGNIATVQATTFNTIQTGFFSTLHVATWQDVSNDIITHFENGIGLDGAFCIQSREDKKNKKFQFLVGSYNTKIKEFGFNFCLSPGGNNEMENGYYEVPANVFLSFIGKIKL